MLLVAAEREFPVLREELPVVPMLLLLTSILLPPVAVAAAGEGELAAAYKRRIKRQKINIFLRQKSQPT